MELLLKLEPVWVPAFEVAFLQMMNSLPRLCPWQDRALVPSEVALEETSTE